MKHLVAVLFVVACEKSGPVEATPGSSTTVLVETPKPMVADAAVATLPNDAANKRDVVVDEDPGMAFADKLTVEGGESEGDMSPRRPGADLGKQIEEARNSKGVTGDPNKGPAGRVSISNKQAFDDTSLTPDAVLAKMQSAYMSGIKRCYKSYLKKDPTARGKIKLTFTVNETGRSVSPKATGFAPEVDTCLSGVMASWRFPIPKDKDGEATDAAFVFGLQLVPD